MYERTVEITLEEYINNKIDMLRRDFKIRLSRAEIEYMQSLTTETAVDNFAHDFFERLK
jgi:hypothetical protein